MTHAELSPRFRARRLLVLHRQSARTPSIPACRSHRDTTRRCRPHGRDYPFEIDAVVVLPDHIHAVWTQPPGDADFSTRWRLIKTRFAKALPKQERLCAVREKRGERGIWQRRFWEHLIRDEADYARHIEYCMINPVKHGQVRRVQDWPHSSFHRDVRRGIFPIDWAGDVDVEGQFGETLWAGSTKA